MDPSMVSFIASEETAALLHFCAYTAVKEFLENLLIYHLV